MGKSTSGSGVEFYPGQRSAIASDVFSDDGIFAQFLQGKPNAGFDRAQTNALQQLSNRQAANGTLNTPLGTRQTSDFLQASTQKAGDNYYEQLSAFMQPAGSNSASKSAGFWGGKG